MKNFISTLLLSAIFVLGLSSFGPMPDTKAGCYEWADGQATRAAFLNDVSYEDEHKLFLQYYDGCVAQIDQ